MQKHKLMEENNIIVDHIQNLTEKIEKDKKLLQDKCSRITEMKQSF